MIGLGPVQIALGGVPAWNPLALAPIGDYLAEDTYLTHSTPPGSTNDIIQWRDRGAFGCDLEKLDDNFPDRQATGWNGTSVAIDFAGSGSGGPFFAAESGSPIHTSFSGSHVPFTICARVQFDGTGQQSLCAWEHSGAGNATSVFGVSSGGKLQYVRQPDAGVVQQVASVANVGTGRINVAVTFSAGGTGKLYINGALDGEASFSPEFVTTNLFKVGTGPLNPNDAVDGRLKLLHVGVREYSAAEILVWHQGALAAYP